MADSGSNTVTPIDVATLQPGAAIPVGPAPATIAAAPGEVLVGNFGNRTLTSIDPATLQRGRTVALPLNPTGIAVAPAGAIAYVCGGAAVVPVAVTGLTLGLPVALPDVGAGHRLERRRLDGLGDPTGGRAGAGGLGHRQGGHAAPPRRAPLGHRRRRRLTHSRGSGRALPTRHPQML